MKINRFIHQIELSEARYAERTETRSEKSAEIDRIKDGHYGDCNLSQIDDPKRIARRMMAFGDGALEGESLIVDSLSSETDRDLTVDFFERIISQNDLVTSWFLNRGASSAKSVGRILIGAADGPSMGSGTGFLVSPQLILTNNHVLSAEQDAGSSLIQFDYVETLRGKQLTPIEFRIRPDVFFETDEALDFTLVAIEAQNASGTLSSSRGWNRLIAASGKAIVGERVNIIQHPGGQRQQLGLRQNEIVDIVGDFLHYSTDTERGSSGSPVFNDQWQLAALHHAGVPLRKNGKIQTISGDDWDGSSATIEQIAWVANEGTRVSRIVDELNDRAAAMTNKERSLYDECFKIFEGESSSLTTDSNTTQPRSTSPTKTILDDLGRATWTIPLQVSVGLGDMANVVPDAAPRARTTAAASKVSPAKTPPKATPKTSAKANASDLRVALQKLREHESDVYYDATSDEQAIVEYYAGIADELVDDELFEALSHLTVSNHHNQLSYKKARLEHLYPWIDRRPIDIDSPDGELELQSIYSGRGFSAEEVIRNDLEIAERHQERFREFMARESQIDEESVEAFMLGLESSDPFNCEHVVPQSWFNKQQPMKADMHHLFTCEPKCNSFRSNIPYFQFPPESEIVRQHCGRRESGKFEPGAGKGVVARATMYFLLRYPKLTGDRNVELQSQRLPILLDWHEAFPVTVYERHRNAEIFKVQGNRNPLIDFPDWARHMALENGFGTP